MWTISLADHDVSDSFPRVCASCKMCDIQFNQSRQYVCIDYPGRVKHAEKMLETLGGIENVNKVILKHIPIRNQSFNGGRDR